MLHCPPLPTHDAIRSIAGLVVCGQRVGRGWLSFGRRVTPAFALADAPASGGAGASVETLAGQINTDGTGVLLQFKPVANRLSNGQRAWLSPTPWAGGGGHPQGGFFRSSNRCSVPSGLAAGRCCHRTLSWLGGSKQSGPMVVLPLFKVRPSAPRLAGLLCGGRRTLPPLAPRRQAATIICRCFPLKSSPGWQPGQIHI